jgi:putative two-component system response regulator
MSATILIVDDSPENLTILTELLRPLYRVLAAQSGERCLQLANGPHPPDLILLDVMMPVMDGYHVLRELRASAVTRSIPVLMLTALADTDNEEYSLQQGAADYIVKPVKPTVMLARVRTQLEAKQARDWLQQQNGALELEVARRMEENNLTQQVSIRALAHLAETRDPETGLHILRTQAYVHRLACLLRALPDYAVVLTPNYIDLLSRSAPLHDIGKVGIPDQILLKPGKLTPAEWAIMQTHARLGSDAIERAERDIVQPPDFLALAKEIAHWHHEKWDGSGYPDGLAGDEIPLSARIMALADVFDALICRRVYKQELSYPAAYAVIAESRGKHFDPQIVDVFLADFAEFTAIADRYQGSAECGVAVDD